jgi:hypothetical protein
VNRFQSEFCALTREMVWSQIRGLQRNAQPHEVPVGDQDMSCAVKWLTDREKLEVPTIKRMSGVGHLDFF